MSGADLIAAERRRQVEVEGYTPEHDHEYHAVFDLMDAATAYLNPISNADWWPWDPSYFKPAMTHAHQPQVRDLVKAGALIAAAIDRLQADG